jgi:pyruvate dehydrogenase E2 component (dihydrolipoamide acetyltransferase)
MARVAIEMPKLGYDMTAGRIAAWVKRVGDDVRRGEVIAEIETDKATVEMEALASGRLAAIVTEAGAEVPIGAVIGYLEDQDGGA